MRFSTIVLFSLLCVSAAGSLCAGELSGRRAPGFALPDSKGRYHDLADYRGKFVLVDIMSTACPHCAVFSKLLEQVKSKYGEKVAILSVVNPPTRPADVAKYVQANGVTVPILFDCGQMAASYLKVTPQKPSFDVPHVFIIDKSGNIVDDYGHSPLTKGVFEGQDLIEILDKLTAAGK